MKLTSSRQACETLLQDALDGGERTQITIIVARLYARRQRARAVKSRMSEGLIRLLEGNDGQRAAMSASTSESQSESPEDSRRWLSPDRRSALSFST